MTPSASLRLPTARPGLPASPSGRAGASPSVVVSSTSAALSFARLPVGVGHRASGSAQSNPGLGRLTHRAAVPSVRPGPDALIP